MFSESNTWVYVLPVVGLASVILLKMSIFCRRYPTTSPPLVSGVPILGVLPYLKGFPERVYKKWSLEKYGPVMAVNMLGEDKVILNTCDVIKKVFLTEGLSTAGRFESFLFGQLQGNHGITFMDYTKYLEAQKSFGLHFITNIGISGLENIINSETEYFIKDLSSKDGMSFDIKVDLFNASANILQLIIFGKRYDYEDPVMVQFYNTFENILGEEKDVGPLFLIENKPALRHLPPFRGAYRRFLERSMPMIDWLKTAIEEAKESLDENNPSCFVKHYLKEQKLRDNENKTEFTVRKLDKNKDRTDSTTLLRVKLLVFAPKDMQLLAYVRDVFGAGIKNVSTTLHWMILLCLLYPDSHKKIVEEINEVLGKHDQPNSESQSRMPFTCAFIEEVQRVCSPLPKSLDHKSSTDVKVGEIIIPKNTKISANLWGAHYDPETWPNPKRFDLHRHISEDGKFVSSHNVMPFSVGPRSCMGEKIARLELFLIFTRFLKQFEVSPADITLPDVDEGRYGITYDPPSYKVILKKRC